MNHDHLAALSVLMFSAPVAVLALGALQLTTGAQLRLRAAPAPARVASLLMLMAAAVHLGLVPGHVEEPLLAVSFAAAAVALTGMAAAALLATWWRPAAAAVLAAILVSYTAILLAGIDQVDVLGIATGGLELAAFGAVFLRRAAGPESARAERGSC